MLLREHVIRSDLYVSLKKFCRADERKKPTFPPTEFLKNWYTRLIDLSYHQKFEKISLTESELTLLEMLFTRN